MLTFSCNKEKADVGDKIGRVPNYSGKNKFLIDHSYLIYIFDIWGIIEQPPKSYIQRGGAAFGNEILKEIGRGLNKSPSRFLMINPRLTKEG
jgi:hypothetical protein